MNDIKKTEHPHEQKRNFKQAVDMPGTQQITEADIARAGEFQRTRPSLARGKLDVPGDGQRSDL